MAAYAYHGNEASDLSFEQGQVILVERQGEDGWWVGKIGDKRGNFPGNYVVPQEDYSSSHTASPVHESTRNASFQEYRVRAVYPYDAQTTEDLRFFFLRLMIVKF